MSPLDEMYGEGMAKAFRTALPDKTKSVNEVQVGDYVRVNVKWARSEMKIDCWPERVHYLHLQSGRKGLYSDLCESLPPLFKERGVVTFTASPASTEAAGVLLKRGDWRLGPRGLVWEL